MFIARTCVACEGFSSWTIQEKEIVSIPPQKHQDVRLSSLSLCPSLWITVFVHVSLQNVNKNMNEHELKKHQKGYCLNVFARVRTEITETWTNMHVMISCVHMSVQLCNKCVHHIRDFAILYMYMFQDIVQDFIDYFLLLPISAALWIDIDYWPLFEFLGRNFNQFVVSCRSLNDMLFTEK